MKNNEDKICILVFWNENYDRVFYTFLKGLIHHFYKLESNESFYNPKKESK